MIFVLNFVELYFGFLIVLTVNLCLGFVCVLLSGFLCFDWLVLVVFECVDLVFWVWMGLVCDSIAVW